MDLSLLPWVSVILALINVVFTLLYVKKSNETTAGVLGQYFKDFKKQIDDEFTPIIMNNRKVMGIIADKSATTRQSKSALKVLGEDIINKNEVLINAVEAVSPAFADSLRNNPDLVLQLAPRIESLLSNTGLLEGLNLGNNENIKKKHPFMNT